MKHTERIELIVSCVACLSAATVGAAAADFDGTWHGRLTCAKLSFTKGTQNVPIEMTVSGTSVSFSRQVYNPDNTAVVGTEQGSGTVSATGAVSLSSSWKGNRSAYTASYSGTLSAKGGTLRGTQNWTLDGKAESRSCSIALRR